MAYDDILRCQQSICSTWLIQMELVMDGGKGCQAARAVRPSAQDRTTRDGDGLMCHESKAPVVNPAHIYIYIP